MFKLRTLPYAVLTAGLLSAGGAYAQSMYGVDHSQDYQQDRIEHGIRDGQITRSEGYRLEQGERAIDRAQARARADGVVTPQERARVDRMADREGRDIYRQSHDRQQAWGRADGGHDGWGGRDGWGRDGGGGYGSRDGWAQNRSWDHGHDGDRGQHDGWTRGEHNGWDGNRPPGIERREAREDNRIRNGAHDGSLTRGETGRLDRGQHRIDRYEARARSDGVVTPHERNRVGDMQNRQSRQIYADRHNDRTATMPTAGTTATSHNGWSGRGPTYGQQTANSHAGWNAWANGGTRGQAQAQTRPQPRTQPQAPTMRQAAFSPRTSGQMRPATMQRPTTQPRAMNTAGRSWGGGHR